MTAFTRLGSSLWDWPPFLELDDATRIFWLALYTTAEAKRHAPGLWHGGIPSMADASRQRPDVVVDALDRLLERELVEYDPKTRVLRLCELPDAGEFPSNGKVILSWWTRFKSVPDCGVRDAHVATLRWILDTGARQARGGLSPHHEDAWRTTFGTVPIPAPRRRGIRRMTDSDTSTAIQPSLFSSPARPENTDVQTIVHPTCNGIDPTRLPSYPQMPRLSVDNSVSLRHPNKISSPETVSDTVSDTNRIPDPGSRIPDLDLSSGEPPVPRLALVADAPPYTARDVMEAMNASGCWDPACDKTHQDALGAMIATWVAMGVRGVDDFRVLSEYNAHSQRRWSLRQLLGCDLVSEIECARKTLDWRDVQLGLLRAKLP